MLAGSAVFVHRIATDVVTLSDLFGGIEHGPVHLGFVLHQPRVGQHVFVHFLSGARNSLYAAGHINIAFVGDDALRRGGNGLQTRGAKTVDGHTRYGDRAARTQSGLASDVGAGCAFGRSASEDDVINLGGLNASAFDRVLDRVAGKRCAVGHVESALPTFG